MMAKSNEPIKQEPSKHIPVLVTTLIVWAAFGVGGAGVNNFFSSTITGVIIGISYLIYLCVTCCCSDVRGYITNMKAFDDYKNMYDMMVNGKGFFTFWIECYHYETRTDSKGRSRRHKVVTHTATKRFDPTLSEDDSGNISGIKDITKYVFINYIKKYYFADEASAKNYDNAYQSFIRSNTRDSHQNYSSTFGIDGFQDEVGFNALGEGGHSATLFYVLTLLTLAIIYCCILERSVSRYEINIIKRLTC